MVFCLLLGILRDITSLVHNKSGTTETTLFRSVFVKKNQTEVVGEAKDPSPALLFSFKSRHEFGLPLPQIMQL